MAKFLTRKGIVYHIDRIIDQAEEEIVLISPYINADDETKGLIKKTTREVTIDVIYGKRQLKPHESEFFVNLNIKLTYREDLHAKCYLNEKEALLTSMNLYEYSQLNNEEMGILVSRKDDRELYEAIHRQAMEWKKDSSSANAAAGGKKNAVVANPLAKATPVAQAPKSGFCIQCAKIKRINPSQLVKPFCGSCFTPLKKSKGNKFQGRFCHTCGSEYATNLSKPLCRDCYDIYKDVLVLAAS